MQNSISLSQIILELTKRVGKAETSARQFSLLCSDYNARLKETKNPCKIADQYLRHWFSSFLAFRDEIMVLVQGAIYRSYHIEEHAPYSHERSAEGSSGCEARFYVGHKMLSRCSSDGIKYLGHHCKEKVGWSPAMIVDGLINNIMIVMMVGS